MADSGHVLVTGGLGFIGSHTTVVLLEAGYSVTIVDNLNNASPKVEARVRELVGEEASGRLQVEIMDVLEEAKLDKLCAERRFASCIHFAGHKSVAQPLMYYKNNIGSTLTLVECLQRHGCKSLLFSSSATVYGEPQSVPIDESFPVEAINPYGRTKLFIEEILKDLCTSDPEWQVVLLRYFNPVGAHPSGRLGEDPKGYPNNLMPYVQQVAVGRRAELSIFGSDYATVDGTGVRDYIHVMDLAEGHMAALRKLLASSAGDGGGLGCVPYNLGTGTGTSVLQIVTAFGEACGKPIPYKLAPRRPGDAASCYASPALAEEALGWKARRSIAEVCRDQWNWASNNPYGYDPAPAEGGEGA